MSVANNTFLLLGTFASGCLSTIVAKILFSYLGKSRNNPSVQLLNDISSINSLLTEIKFLLEDTVEDLRLFVKPVCEGFQTESDYEDAHVFQSPTFRRKGVFITTDIKDFFKEIDELHDQSESEKMKAYHKLLDKFTVYADNPDFLWRMARACLIAAEVKGRKGFTSEQKELLLTGKQNAQASLNIKDSSEGHKWYAILTGSLTQFVSIQEKIQFGHAFKEHIEKAIAIDPSDSTLYHLLGRWCYEVSLLSWMERKVASTLFAAPPTATIEDALTHFLRAEELVKTPWKSNLLWIAKSYIYKKDFANACVNINRALTALPCSDDDPLVLKELNSLKVKYCL